MARVSRGNKAGETEASRGPLAPMHSMRFVSSSCALLLFYAVVPSTWDEAKEAESTKKGRRGCNQRTIHRLN
jgi:hypothetical protein